MKKLSIIIIALLAILVCCKKTPEVNIKYVDVEREILTIGQTTANIQCDYEYIATLKSAKLYYGISEATSYVEMRVVQSSLYAELSGLNSGTTYQYYYEFTNGFNSMQSGVKTFVTETAPISLPTVITADITEITSDSAIGGGEVTNDGGSSVTARGVCWSTSTNPTIDDSHTNDGTGIGIFISSLTGLNPNTTYHVRAYAINEAGTAYGLDKEFTTLNGGGEAPTGAINGLFTINANGDQVYFSQGNLQYQASTNTWRFAENQWDYVGDADHGTVYANGEKCNNTLISQTYNGWIDLFGWGTSGWNNGNAYYNPYDYYMISYGEDLGYGYGPTVSSNYTYDLTSDFANADWGIYNAISNGSNTNNLWRTPNSDEYEYIINSRVTPSGIRFAKAFVNSINGIILLPDDWNSAIYALNNFNEPNSPYNVNIISEDNWNVLETNGAVFLAQAGFRYCLSFENNVVASNDGYYWTVTHYETGNAYFMYFWGNNVTGGLDLHTGGGLRCYGFSVRLIQDANK